VRIAWIVYGDLDQPTGGYVYDRLVVEGLRAGGDEVEVVDPRESGLPSEQAEVLVGDSLCVREIGPLFERVSGPAARVLLVHHLPSWEIERSDRDSMRRHEGRALAASDHAIATSAMTRERLLGEGAVVPVDVVAPGADRLPRASRRSEADVARVELLFVGGLVARKRVALLLDVLQGLPAPHPRLTLLGDSDREPAYARAIMERIDASPLLRGIVTIAGVVGDDVLARWLARADALVLPSSLEGYGMVMTEALHAGLPVIAARPAAKAGAIAEHAAVLMFDDRADLADLLRRFVHEPGLRKVLRADASAESLPTWSGAIDAFRRALGSARGRPSSQGGNRQRP
jgi:glycosyltransferase involved in cell wall biosynthesis